MSGNARGVALHHRQQIWTADQSKADRVLEIIKDPIFAEAVDLVFAETRQRDNVAVGVDPVTREFYEREGMQRFLDRLHALATPANSVISDLFMGHEWSEPES